jgi:hypothetical protein
MSIIQLQIIIKYFHIFAVTATFPHLEPTDKYK